MLCCRVITADNEEPQCVEEALKGKHSDKWKQALEAEYNSLIDNKIWELVQPPESSNIVGSKWVLKIKRDANGNNINRHKARLVAQGYSQNKALIMRKCSRSQVFKHQDVVSASQCTKFISISNGCQNCFS